MDIRIKSTCILFAFVMLINCRFGQAESLPEPAGKYLVGVTYLSFIDNNRTEIFDPTSKKHRELTVKAWYPSDSKAALEPYLLKPEAELVTKYMGFPAVFKEIQTNSSRDVPLSSKEKNYPVLIFSHGWGEHYSQNTILMEELASHGYVVFSLSHHYECKFASFPDGRMIYIEMSNPILLKKMEQMNNPQAFNLLKKLQEVNNDTERLKVIRDTYKTLPVLLVESRDYWAGDISFFINQLDNINTQSKIFSGKLALDKIGVFGMSLGGLASTEISISDKRIKACVNIDGGFTPSILERGIQVPNMYLNSKRYLGYGNLFTSQSKADSYSLTVRGSDHYNFTDYSLYPVPAVFPLIGPIAATRINQIMNVFVVNFFDRYLKGNRDTSIRELAKKFPEIEMAANIH